MKLGRTGRFGGRMSKRKRLIVLVFCMVLGMLLGQWAHGWCPDGSSQLQEYLLNYAKLRTEDMVPSLWVVLWVYLRYPLAAFLLGLTAWGIILLPVLLLAQGFLLSFSVACFSAALARRGIVLALAALGVRCLVTLPCLLLLAVHGWEAAQLRACGPRQERLVCDGVYVLRFLMCLLLLLLGTVLERYVVPEFFALALTGG